MSEQIPHDNEEVVLALYGLLTCISDALIIYQDFKVLYSNAEGLMLLEQTNHNILKDLQFNRNENCIHQIRFKVPDSTIEQKNSSAQIINLHNVSSTITFTGEIRYVRSSRFVYFN